MEENTNPNAAPVEGEEGTTPNATPKTEGDAAEKTDEAAE